jgi:hypothetical protein
MLAFFFFAQMAARSWALLVSCDHVTNDVLRVHTYIDDLVKKKEVGVLAVMFLLHVQRYFIYII